MRAHLVASPGSPDPHGLRRRVRIAAATAVAAAAVLASAAPALSADPARPDNAPAPAAARPAAAPPDAAVPGSTQTIPFSAFSRRSLAPGGAPPVSPFDLVGLTWKNPDERLSADVAVRVRNAATGRWSGWQSVQSGDGDDAPDADQRAAGARGGTAPLWVGRSDGLRVRVRPTGSAPLPAGLRADLVDPGSAADAVSTPVAVPSGSGTRELARPETRAARPAIVTRKGWGADEKLREKQFVYTGSVKAVFIHHTATGNNYSCKDAPAVIRSIYRYHVKSNGWRDIGYNFLVDKCGKIYEGRAGGVTKPVLGAHTLGFNTDTTGIAAIGSYQSANPPAAMLRGLAQISGWKLSLAHHSPTGTVTLTSGDSGSRYKKGTKHKFHTISGHRDGFSTECPGAKLYAKLGTIRSLAAKQ